MSWTAAFACFLVAHMVGDYLFQTDWQARHKKGGLTGDRLAFKALTMHVASYTAAFLPVLVWIAGETDVGWAVLAAALIALPHLALDDGRFVSLYVTRVKGVGESAVGIATSVDQSFHVLSLFFVALLLGAA